MHSSTHGDGPARASIERAYDATRSAAQAAPPARVFAATGATPGATSGRDSMPDDLLRVCGGETCCGLEQAGVTLDDILAASRGCCLCPASGRRLRRRRDPARRAGHPRRASQRIHRVDMTLLTLGGTPRRYALRDLPALLMPGGNSEQQSATARGKRLTDQPLCKLSKFIGTCDARVEPPPPALSKRERETAAAWLGSPLRGAERG